MKTIKNVKKGKKKKIKQNNLIEQELSKKHKMTRKMGQK